MTSANLKGRTVSRCRINIRVRYLQYNEYCADHDTLEAPSKNWVRNDRECLVDYHVRQEESHEEEVAILPDRFDFLCIAFLFTVRCILGVRRVPKDPQTQTHGVPLMLRTFNWVSSKLMYPKVSPANTPERITRTGIRHPKTIFLVSESSSRLAYVWPPWVLSATEAGSAGKMEVMNEGKKSDRTALLLTKRRPRPVETLITIRVSERINRRQPTSTGRSVVVTTIKGRFFPCAES